MSMQKELDAKNTSLENPARRNFTRATAAITAAIPLSALIANVARAASPVDESSAQAKALKYMATSDKEGKMCGNCTLFQGKAGDAAGGCPLFSGSEVKSSAWCSAWVPKA